jgi:hypothetical protein
MPLQLPPVVAVLAARLNQIGFERTRRALAALALSGFVTLYFLVSMNPDLPDGLGRVFLALSLCYGVAFVAVVAEFFWGRWFATGLAWSGIMMAIAMLALLGWAPALAMFGGLHLVVALSLMGKKMAARYDMQEAWRSRYKMDEFGVARLQKTVTRAAASLPGLIIWALGPKEEALVAAGALTATLLAVVGLRGLIRMRSWGVVALAGAGVLAAGVAGAGALFARTCHRGAEMGLLAELNCVAAPLAIALLAAAVLPFAGATTRFLRRAA